MPSMTSKKPKLYTNAPKFFLEEMPPKDPLENNAPKTWRGTNAYDFILETNAPSISFRPIAHLRGTNSQCREAAKTKGLETNVFLPKMDFLGIPYNIKHLIGP